MIQRGGPAQLVNTSSGSGLVMTGGAQFMYCASKYAVTGLSEAIANLLKLNDIGLTLSVQASSTRREKLERWQQYRREIRNEPEEGTDDD